MDERFLFDYVADIVSREEDSPGSNDATCFICRSDFPPTRLSHEPPYSSMHALPLGCACPRKAHVLCAYRCFAPRIEFRILGSIWGQLQVDIACQCDVCYRDINNNLIQHYMKHAFAAVYDIEEKASIAFGRNPIQKPRTLAHGFRSFVAKVFTGSWRVAS
jgi:hypothetical protein